MENNALFESFMCHNQSNLFIYASSQDVNIVSFVNEYMKSEMAIEMDSSYSNIQTRSYASLFSMFINAHPKLKLARTKNCNEYNLEAIEWLGYFYRKWHFITGETSKRIVGQLSPKEGLYRYFELHQMNFKDAIDLCKREYNIKRNAHRKYEVSKNILSNKELLENYTKEALAKTLLIKSYTSATTKSLKIEKNKNCVYNLMDNNKTMGVVVEKIDIFSSKNICKSFKKTIKEISHLKTRCKDSILFMVPVQLKTKSDEPSLIIDDFYKEYIKTANDFSSVYIYYDAVLYRIDKLFGISKMILGTTLRKVKKQDE